MLYAARVLHLKIQGLSVSCWKCLCVCVCVCLCARVRACVCKDFFRNYILR